jgi:hypothetical protein
LPLTLTKKSCRWILFRQLIVISTPSAEWN